MAATPNPQVSIGLLETDLVIQYLIDNEIGFDPVRLATLVTIDSVGYVTESTIKVHSECTEAELDALILDVETNQQVDTTPAAKNATTDSSTKSVDTLNAEKNAYYGLTFTDGDGDEQTADQYGDDPTVGGSSGSDDPDANINAAADANQIAPAP